MIPHLTDMPYARARTAALIGLSIYIAVGFSAHVLSNGGEDAYPFFSWFLFVNVPQRVQSGFDVVVVDGMGAQSLTESDAFFGDGMMRDILALENRLGRAVKGGNPLEIAEARRELESFLSGPVTYRVREITYDPLEYFSSKAVLEATVLAEYLL